MRDPYLPVPIDHLHRANVRPAFIGFNDRRPAEQFESCIRKLGREHSDRAVLVHAKEDARREEYLRAPVLRPQFSAFRNVGELAELLLQPFTSVKY